MPIFIHTDHIALLWLLSLKRAQGRIMRWVVALQEYNFTVKHRPGAVHTAADGLSRCPLFMEGQNTGKEDDEVCTGLGVLHDGELTVGQKEAVLRVETVEDVTDLEDGVEGEGFDSEVEGAGGETLPIEGF